jgi:uncharacterized protein (TIGR03790 family)
VVTLGFSQTGYALNPEEIAIVINHNNTDSLPLARYYQQKRNIPDQNIIQINTLTHEGISRDEYNQHIALPVKTWLLDHPDIRCLVLMYGIPLRINDHIKPDTPGNKEQTHDPVASVDSELSLVKIDQYPLDGWLPNPYFPGNGSAITYPEDNILLVSRLDGSSPALVRRIIDDAFAAEQERLTGIAYFDARWPAPPNNKKVHDYKFYDRSIHRAARLAKKFLPVELDEKPSLFAPSACPAAALYCGWYSLGHYIDSFTWKQGAIGYHIASAECTTLKKKDSSVWCKRILETGAAVTLGPVGEPYVQAFPVPDIFFKLILEGRTSLVETYYKSSPFISWKMVLIGDPLYRPFKYRTRRIN